MSRCTEELPWLLKRAEWKEELYHTIINIDMFIQLYSRYDMVHDYLMMLYKHIVCNCTRFAIRIYELIPFVVYSGRSAELLSYWQFLDPAVSVMATQYYKSLRKLEEGSFVQY